jgi:hypothetical protein
MIRGKGYLMLHAVGEDTWRWRLSSRAEMVFLSCVSGYMGRNHGVRGSLLTARVVPVVGEV